MKAAIVATAALLASSSLATSQAWAQFTEPQQPQVTAPEAMPEAMPEATPQIEAPQSRGEEFIHNAIRDNIGDVELGRLAREHADAPDSVRQLGGILATENIELNGELARLAQSQGVAVSNQLLDRDREALEQLSGLSGDDFTNAYLSLVVSELERDLERYQEAARTADDPAIREFAETTAPRIQRQLQTARAVHDAQTAANP